MTKQDMTNDMRDYFNTLPENIKQSIIESGADIKDLNDLKTIARNLSER